jgi:hypothetical protein
MEVGGGGGMATKSFDEFESSTPTAVLLIRHLGSNTTELEVADTFRVYAPVSKL